MFPCEERSCSRLSNAYEVALLEDDEHCSEMSWCYTDGLCYTQLSKIELKESLKSKFYPHTHNMKLFKGCFTSDQLIPPIRPLVCELNLRKNQSYLIECCSPTERHDSTTTLTEHDVPCNFNANLTLHPIQNEATISNSLNLVSTVSASICSFFIVVSLIAVIVYLRSRGRMPRRLQTKTSNRGEVSTTVNKFSVGIDCNLFDCVGLRGKATPTSGMNEHEIEGIPSCGKEGLLVDNLNGGCHSAHQFSSTLDAYIAEMSTTSGSGSGLPLLVQRSIARQILLKNVLGQGRFGEVFRGEWADDFVAVKIFASREEISWQREVNIYQSCMLRHENVLRFIAADNKDTGITTELWLVTEFIPLGSLHSFLSSTYLDIDNLISLSLGMASGLSYLHTAIDGHPQSKPCIAHRDLKSTNVLIKDISTVKSQKVLIAVIADFGLAFTHHDSYVKSVHEESVPQGVSIGPMKRGVVNSNTTVGTKRYLAPELLVAAAANLDGNNDSHSLPVDFNVYSRADIYAVGLVLWELMVKTDPPLRQVLSGDGDNTVMISNSVCICNGFLESEKPLTDDKNEKAFVLNSSNSDMESLATSSKVTPNKSLTNSSLSSSSSSSGGSSNSETFSLIDKKSDRFSTLKSTRGGVVDSPVKRIRRRNSCTLSSVDDGDCCYEEVKKAKSSVRRKLDMEAKFRLSCHFEPSVDKDVKCAPSPDGVSRLKSPPTLYKIVTPPPPVLPRLPYDDFLPSDPSLHEVYTVVCVEKRRPSLHDGLLSSLACLKCCDRRLMVLMRIVSECWYEDASARPTAARIKKNLMSIASKR